MLTREIAEANGKKYGLTLSKDDETVGNIILALNRNCSKYGSEHCPCVLNRTIDTICPCKEARETKYCYCGLYMDGSK